MVVMGIYNDRLTARTDRKRVIFNHKLLDYRKNTALDKKRTKEQRDLHQKLKPFARIMSHPDFVDFSEDLEKEQNLRQAIAQLQEWRRMRISTLSAGEKYEAEKAARLARNTQALGAFDRMTNGIRVGKPPPPVETATAVTEYTTKELPVRLSPTTGTNGLATPPVSDISPKRPPLAPIPNLIPMRMDEDNAPDWQIVPAEERDLCSKLRLQPKAYYSIKDAIMREALKNDGKLKKKQVREMAHIDTTRAGRVFEFFVDQGWIINAARA